MGSFDGISVIDREVASFDGRGDFAVDARFTPSDGRSRLSAGTAVLAELGLFRRCSSRCYAVTAARMAELGSFRGFQGASQVVGERIGPGWQPMRCIAVS